MSEHFPAEIIIGGKLPVDMVGQLLEVIESSKASVDWDGSTMPSSQADLIENALINNGRILLLNAEASYGAFYDLEQWIQKTNLLHYIRHSDAKYEFDSELSIFHPGMEQPRAFQSDQAEHSDNIYVSSKKILELTDAARALCHEGLEADDLDKVIQELLAHLEELSGKGLLEVPPFELVQ